MLARARNRTNTTERAEYEPVVTFRELVERGARKWRKSSATAVCTSLFCYGDPHGCAVRARGGIHMTEWCVREDRTLP